MVNFSNPVSFIFLRIAESALTRFIRRSLQPNHNVNVLQDNLTRFEHTILHSRSLLIQVEANNSAILVNYRGKSH